MQHLEVSCAVRLIYTSLGAKGLIYAVIIGVTGMHGLMNGIECNGLIPILLGTGRHKHISNIYYGNEFQHFASK